MEQKSIPFLTADDRTALGAMMEAVVPRPELAFVTFARAAGRDIRTYYRGADLRGYVLRDQILSDVNLEGADLRHADLRGAIDFQQAGTLIEGAVVSVDGERAPRDPISTRRARSSILAEVGRFAGATASVETGLASDLAETAPAASVSWDQLHRDCRALASRLQRAGPFYAIVTTSNGGLVVAAIVARELNIQTIETLCMSSQGESGPEEEPKILKKVADEVAAIAGGAGQGVLIIDDVATNSTVEVVRSMLPKAHVAAVYTRPISRSLVDTFITEVSTHSSIYLPWETAVAFQPPIHEDGS